MVLGNPLPEISISPAPVPEPSTEPYSPFACSFAQVSDDEESFRPSHLAAPPSSPMFKPLSPLRPAESLSQGAGIQRERFEAMLKASRERQAAVAAKRDTALRKEIALKTHKNKQVERRALFLSKVLAPPSPTAASLPKTPPESPAIFHYTLPSPGLVSPLSLFETLESPESGLDEKTTWVEQVDFRLPAKVAPKVVQPAPAPAKIVRAPRPLPSLAQISAHINNRSGSPPNESKGNRLPAFLASPRRLPTPPGERPRLPANVGRLNVPVRAPQPVKADATMLPPPTPTSPLTPRLQVTTTRVPRTAAMSPTQLTEMNLSSFNSREHRAKTMLSAIRKRNSVPSECGITGHDMESVHGQKTMKRKSAPGDLETQKLKIWGATPIAGGF